MARGKNNPKTPAPDPASLQSPREQFVEAVDVAGLMAAMKDIRATLRAGVEPNPEDFLRPKPLDALRIRSLNAALQSLHAELALAVGRPTQARPDRELAGAEDLLMRLPMIRSKHDIDKLRREALKYYREKRITLRTWIELDDQIKDLENRRDREMLEAIYERLDSLQDAPPLSPSGEPRPPSASKEEIAAAMPTWGAAPGKAKEKLN